jgi:membrane protein DedA with SNARE-associated domain
MMSEWINWLGSFYDEYGYLVVFLSSFCENTALLGFFMPGNSLVLLGAFYARIGSLNLGMVILLATLGTIIGYHLDFLLGRFFLAGFLVRVQKTRLGRRMRLPARIRLARMLLNKHGGKAIVLSHVTSQMRSVIAISAGFTHMRYRTFLIYEVIAATLWNTVYALLGYFVAGEIDRLALIINRVGWGMLLVLVLLFLAWYIFIIRKRGLRRSRRRRAVVSARQRER